MSISILLFEWLSEGLELGKSGLWPGCDLAKLGRSSAAPLHSVFEWFGQMLEWIGGAEDQR